MKRFISALALCVSLLVLLILFLFPPAPASAAKENAIIKLLNLPAPPPPNPLVRGTRPRDDKFYDRNNPPRDDAPIEDLIDYWTNQRGAYSSGTFAINYSNRPSARTLDRLMAEIPRRPELTLQLLDILPNDKAAIDAVKELYDNGGIDSNDLHEKRRLRDWLKFNSPYFSRDLERVSSQIKDENNYVSQNNENTLLALTRHDFDKASPIINQLYNDPAQPVSRVLATWALYRRALDTDSLSDIERYRSELMRTVEDRNASAGVRDKANDALMLEKDFPERDDWAFSLFDDETLVAITQYTMVTTLIRRSPPEKYAPKLIALLQRTSNPTVRGAAVRNLVIALNGSPGAELEVEIIKALLPWLEDAKWAADADGSRMLLVRKLIERYVPESVPGLIKVIDEKENGSRPNFNFDFNANIPTSSANAVMLSANAVTAARRATNSTRNSAGPTGFSYPYRQAAIPALGKQKDGRAVPALRRVLYEVNGYERSIAVNAILDCGGFTLAEQMAALESAAKQSNDQAAAMAAENTGTATNNGFPTFYGLANRIDKPRFVTELEIRDLLGQQLLNSEEISDELARAIVDRIEELDGKNPSLAGAFRRMILKWQNAVINMLLLRDVKRDIADADTIVRLLSQRKSLREKQPNDVVDLRNGKASAVGIGACLFEDQTDYITILEDGDAETKTAMLACARLIRSPLPVAKVAENLKSPNQMLQIAAERYLESEDSPEARAFVLARHPNEAMILGATSAFYVKDAGTETSTYLWALYQSLVDESLYNGWGRSHNDDEIAEAEKQLQAEVKKDLDLLGVYAYDRNYIRIYKDRVMFSWDEDDSRYRERPLTSYEFEEIKSYFTTNRVDELTPFLACRLEYCSAKELVMLGRNGGRRVYFNGSSEDVGTVALPDFFAWLDKYFADLKLTRATLKYALSREIPGLEILLASDELHAETVWAQGADVRVAATDLAARKKVEAEIENAFPEDVEADDEAVVAEHAAKKATMTEKRRYEGFAWYKTVDGAAISIAAQPPQVQYIPQRDALAVQPGDEQWKARAGDVELRASNEALFKNVRGRLTKIRAGSFDNIVVTPNGRWAVAVKFDEERGPTVVRIDLLANREYTVEIKGYGKKYPVAYVPTLNKILVVNTNYYHHESEYASDQKDTVPDDIKPEGMFLLDAATGVMQPVAGEFRPLAQQTFRALQSAAQPNEFWAAIYDAEKKETQIGIYDAKVFGFKPVLRVPKIKFNSMSLWVDETAGKAHFVYRGHLLALPLRK